MYIRLVVPVRHVRSHRLMGVIRATDYVLDTDLLEPVEHERLNATLDWFNFHLPVPDRFSRSLRAGASPSAICWFKEGAGRFVSRARELAGLLERHGVPTRMLRTRRPGYVVYEDAFQVAAVPFRDTKA